MKTLTGTVVSVAMKNTIVVVVTKERMHPLYKKIIRSTKRYKVHCENADIKVNDTVKIASHKPISKDKHFALVGKITE